MYQNVIFDLDGTLLDTLGDLATACNHTLSALGLPAHPMAAYRKMVGNGIPKLVRRMLPEENRDDATFTLARCMFESYYARHMKDLTQPYPGVCELLKALKKRKVAMGVVSNKKDNFTQDIVREYFKGMFGAVVGLRDDMMPKPDPASVQWLMRHLQAAAPATLYVGDSDVDMRTALNAGLHGCGVLWGFRDRDELYTSGATFLVSTADELERLVLEDTPDPAFKAAPARRET